MLVKLVHYNENHEPLGIQEMYDCSRFEIFDGSTYTSSAVVLGSRDLGEISITLNKPLTDMYIMNDFGKTVEHYAFKYVGPDNEK
jgi:hypothetical protein